MSYLNVGTAENALTYRSLAEQLSNALNKNRQNLDIDELKSECKTYLDREKCNKVKKESVIEHVIKGIRSFNIAPSNSYEHYLSVVLNRSDTESIQSDWEAVGEDLSFAYINHILESDKKQHGR